MVSLLLTVQMVYYMIELNKHLGDVQKVVVVTECTPFNHGSVAT